MSKPWEEEWRAEGASWVERRTDTASIAHIQTGTIEKRAAYARLVAAAPDMARALLFDLGECGHTDDCSYMVTVGGTVTCSSSVCRQKRAALTKAGVPLP